MATEASRALEAILMVAQEPVDPHILAQVLEVSPARVAELCHELEAAYRADDRGFALVKVAGGYRFQSHGDLAPYVERFVLEGQTARLSSAALETLAIVAYKQPISRAQVAAIRGVNVDGVMRTLQQRGYIEEVARDPGPGQATLFGTTREFLERLGLDRVEDLPAIADLFPSADVLEALEKGLRADPPPQAGAVPAGPTEEDGAPAEDVGARPADGVPAPEPGGDAAALGSPPGSTGDGDPATGRGAGPEDLELPDWFTEAEERRTGTARPPGPGEDGEKVAAPSDPDADVDEVAAPSDPDADVDDVAAPPDPDVDVDDGGAPAEPGTGTGHEDRGPTGGADDR